MAHGPTQPIRPTPIIRQAMSPRPRLCLPPEWVWAPHGATLGVIPTGEAATWMLMLTAIPTSITISTAVNTKGETGDKQARDKAAGSSIIPNIARAFPIATRELRRNLIARVHPTRSNRVRIFAVAPTPAGRTSGAVARETVEGLEIAVARAGRAHLAAAIG